LLAEALGVVIKQFVNFQTCIHYLCFSNSLTKNQILLGYITDFISFSKRRNTQNATLYHNYSIHTKIFSKIAMFYLQKGKNHVQ